MTRNKSPNTQHDVTITTVRVLDVMFNGLLRAAVSTENYKFKLIYFNFLNNKVIKLW